MSDQTLYLWGKILQAIPDAVLVLKANASEDDHTQRILRNRMMDHGLDPDRVEWLPLTKRPWSISNNIQKWTLLWIHSQMVVVQLPVNLCGWVYL